MIDYLFRAFPIHVNHHYYVFQNSKGEPKRICKWAHAKRDSLKKISFADLIAQLKKDFSHKKTIMHYRELLWLKEIVNTMKEHKAKKIGTKSKFIEKIRLFFSEIQNKLKGYGFQTSDKIATNLLADIETQLAITKKPGPIRLNPLPEIPQDKIKDELKLFLQEVWEKVGPQPKAIQALKQILDSNSTDYSRLNEKDDEYKNILDFVTTHLSLKKEDYYTIDKINSWRKWLTILVKECKVSIFPDKKGVTPLHSALQYGYLPTLLIETFIQLGVDPSKKDSLNHDALYKATWYESSLEPKAVEILAQHGCDVNAQYSDDQNLIHSMIHQHIPTNIVEALLKCGANPNSSASDATLGFGFDDNKPTDPELLKVLANFRADIYGTGYYSPLALAAWKGETKCIQTLLDLGVDPIERNHDEETVMHLVAAQQVSPEKLKPLITKETIKALFLGKNFLDGYKLRNNVEAIKKVKEILKENKC